MTNTTINSKANHPGPGKSPPVRVSHPQENVPKRSPSPVCSKEPYEARSACSSKRPAAQQQPQHQNMNAYQAPYPDIATVPSELSFEGNWDGEAVSELIRSKSVHGETPAFLYLGRKEAT